MRRSRSGSSHAWDLKGGDGAGQALVDVEQGWNLEHEDLDPLKTSLLWGLSETTHYHGTSVLGIIAATDNDLGIVGIAPAVASLRCSSQWDPSGRWDTCAAVLNALEAMAFGDVLLLEVQSALTGYYEMPAECDDDVFDLVRLATALGIVVVEAAGNGGEDLDAVEVSGSGFIFDRAVRDSGAIIVGAATASDPHTRYATSCHGSRVDCFAWGEKVVTLSTDTAGTADTLYDEEFGETSAAAAIIAGVALIIQGLAEAAFTHRLSPGQVRAVLSDPDTGTALDGDVIDEIGVMPDLRRIIDGEVLKLIPDVYMRDYVGDKGDAHEGPVSESPDVILVTSVIADPQAAFGEGSGVEDDASLGGEATAGVDNYVHVRVRNRGGSDAEDVRGPCLLGAALDAPGAGRLERPWLDDDRPRADRRCPDRVGRDRLARRRCSGQRPLLLRRARRHRGRPESCDSGLPCGLGEVQGVHPSQQQHHVAQFQRGGLRRARGVGRVG